MPDLTTKKGMAEVLQDVRHMHRAVKMQNMTDPVQVQQMLNQILAEAVALRSENEGALGDKAIKELQNVRRSLVTGQIKTGGETEKYLKKVSEVLDQVEDVDKERRADKPGVAGYAKKAGKSILSHIPSLDTMIEGLTVANPILGYGAHVVKDIFESRSEEKKEHAAERNEKIKGIANSLNDVEGGSKLEKMPMSGPGLGSDQIVITKLDGIKDGVDNLYKVWEPEGGQTQLEKLTDATQESMEKVSDHLEKTNSQLEKIQKDTTDSKKNLVAIKELDKQDIQDQKKKGALGRLKDRVGQYKNGIFSNGEDLLKKGKGLGLLDLLGAGSLLKGIFGEGLIGKIVSGELIASIIKKAFGILGKGFLSTLALFFTKNGWKTLLTGAVDILPQAGIATLLTSLVYGMVGFVKGIFDPHSALGVDKKTKLTLSDRINAAEDGFYEGIVGMINDVASLFGDGFIKNHDDLVKKTRGYRAQVEGWIDTQLDNFKSFFVGDPNAKDKRSSIDMMIDAFTSSFKSMSDDVIKSIENSDTGKEAKHIMDVVDDFFKNMIKKSLDIFSDIGQWFEDAYMNVKNGIKHGIDLVKQGADNAGQAVTDSAKYILKSLGISDSDDPINTTLMTTTGMSNPTTMLQQASSTMANAAKQQSSSNKPNVVVAPQTVNNVQNTTAVHNMTGARNNDSTYHRVHQRQLYYAVP